MKSIFTIFLLASLLCGCAGMHTEINSTQDKFTGKTINETFKNDLNMGFTDAGAMMLDARQEIDEQNNSQYFLLLSSFSLSGAALMPKPWVENLFVVADTNHYALASIRHENGQYYYPVTRAQMLMICYANDVEVRVLQITGSTFEKSFNARNRENFKKFADRFLSATNAVK